MSWFNFYHVRDTCRYVWSIRIKLRVFVLRRDKINYKWKWKFIYYKLENLDIIGLYHEVGYAKIE
jgi:hypothetical protein